MAKIGTKYIGWYSPERAFVSVHIRKTLIYFECFSRGDKIEGTRVSNIRFAPRWVKFNVKSDKDIEKAFDSLNESYNRIKEALKNGEQTGYYSGGEPFGSVKDVIEEVEEEHENE